MSDKKVWNLKIDTGFKNLIHPLLDVEFQTLEKSVKEYGCESPIVVWHGFIIDGHNRYRICTENNIPFSIEIKDFGTRDEVIAWICTNQLGRRNITEETRKYLIGKLYEAEKSVDKQRNKLGINQFTSNDKNSSGGDLKYSQTQASLRTAEKIAESNHISHGTVEKYAIYSKAIESIEGKSPEMASKILTGKYKVSHNGVVELGQMNANELENIKKRLDNTKKPFVRYADTKKEIMSPSQACMPQEIRTQSIKDMPAYDPDSDLTQLIFTIPSWWESLERVTNTADFKNASNESKKKLQQALIRLDGAALKLLSALRR